VDSQTGRPKEKKYIDNYQPKEQIDRKWINQALAKFSVSHDGKNLASKQSHDAAAIDHD
jgi:hypothetical protein